MDNYWLIKISNLLIPSVDLPESREKISFVGKGGVVLFVVSL